MKCEGIFGRLFGHNYQPVFNKFPPEKIEVSRGTVCAMSEVVDAMTRTEFVHTCCTRCGHTIEAKQQ